MIPSPCIKICEMDSRAGLCRGCGRTLNEIARWGAMSDQDRALIMAGLAERLRTAGLVKPDAPG